MSGAKTRKGPPCKAAAIWTRRFTRLQEPRRLSRGSKTAEGVDRIRRARTKPGSYSAG